MRFLLLFAVLILALTGMSSPLPASAISNLENPLVGHPKERFPLTVYAVPGPSKALNYALQDAVAQWNEVFEQVFRRAAFAWTNNEADADVLIRFIKSAHLGHEMGETNVDADRRGVIRLPVKINLLPPKPRGGTDARQMLFDVAAHELGHALGLPHVNDPSSIMCCQSGGINFNDPATREAYVKARRHPDLRTVAPELAAHYRKFWKQIGSGS